MTRLAIQTIATVILGMSAVGLMLSTLVMQVIPPYQWYPVGVYHIRLLVTPDQILVIPSDREVPEAIELPNRQPGFLSVDATVTLERPVPQTSSGRSGWKRYSPSYNQPSSDAIKNAGPERAATVHLSAHTTFPQFTMLTWTTGNPPTKPLPVDSLIPRSPIPEDTVRRILPVLAEATWNERGDDWLRDAVKLGGVPRPAATYFERSGRDTILLAFLGLAGISALALLILRWVPRPRVGRARQARLLRSPRTR